MKRRLEIKMEKEDLKTIKKAAIDRDTNVSRMLREKIKDWKKEGFR